MFKNTAQEIEKLVRVKKEDDSDKAHITFDLQDKPNELVKALEDLKVHRLIYL